MFSLIDNTIGPVINEASAVYVVPRWKTVPPPQLQLQCSSQKPLSGMINSNHQSFPAPSTRSSLRHQYDCEAPTSRAEELRVREPIRPLDHIFSQTITRLLEDRTNTGELIKENVSPIRLGTIGRLNISNWWWLCRVLPVANRSQLHDGSLIWKQTVLQWECVKNKSVFSNLAVYLLHRYLPF